MNLRHTRQCQSGAVTSRPLGSATWNAECATSPTLYINFHHAADLQQLNLPRLGI